MAKGNALMVGSNFGPDFEFLIADQNFYLSGGHLHYPAGPAFVGPFCPLVSPIDGNLYVWSATGDLLRYDVDTLDFVQTIQGGLSGFNFVFDGMGRIVIASSDCKISTIDPSTGGLELLIDNSTNFNCSTTIACIQWAPPPRLELCVLVHRPFLSGGGGALLRFDGSTGQSLGFLIPFDYPSEPRHLNPGTAYFCFGPDGDIYASNDYRDINRFDGSTGQFVDTFVSGSLIQSTVTHLLFSPDGKKLYVTVTGEVLEFDCATRAHTKTFMIGTINPGYCCWISSEWVGRQIRNGWITQVPQPRPQPLNPRIEHTMPTFPVSPLDVLATMYRRASRERAGTRGHRHPLAQDEVIKYGLRVLSGMLSDRRAAALVHRGLEEAFGTSEREDLRALLHRLQEPTG